MSIVIKDAPEISLADMLRLGALDISPGWERLAELGVSQNNNCAPARGATNREV